MHVVHEDLGRSREKLAPAITPPEPKISAKELDLAQLILQLVLRIQWVLELELDLARLELDDEGAPL